jgi:hypothetical protein
MAPATISRLRAGPVAAKILAIREVGMSDYLRVARLYMIVLAIFTVGRLLTGARGVPYENGHHVFSLVTMTFLASAFYGAFCRKWRGYGVMQAMALGLTIGLLAQVVVVLATVLSYALQVDTYFVNPRAITGEAAPQPLPFGSALGFRLGGLVVNAIMNAIAAAIGWVMGALLPAPGEA